MELLPDENLPFPVLAINDDKLETLRLAGLEVTELAPLLTFDSIESFRKQSNNFPMFFKCAHIGPLVENLIHSRPAYQRFAKVFPTEAFWLEGLTANCDWGDDSKIWPIMFDTYKAMANLVDVADNYVIRDGSVDIYYLIR